MIDQLVANFRIIREIGRGGFAVVYEAEHPLIHSRVAIKVLHSYHASDPDLVKRLFVEAQVVNRVNHPGLLRIENCGRLPDGAPYLIMELLRGETLRKRLDRGPLRANERALLRMVAETMSVAHEQGIIHRDLTPNNVMILEEPDPRIKVLDFGLAKVSEELRSRSDPRPQTVGMVGAVEYTAPEQWGDASQVTDKADVYALGVILYEALSGRRPFSGTPLQLMRLHNMERPPPLLEPNIPTELAALCLAMLEKKPEDRPTMRAVAEQLHPPVLKKSLNKVGNYLLHRELGKGGYGTVYEAVHEQLGDRRAIKILRPDTPASAVERFFNEARSASRAKHPHIVEIYDCGTADEHPYIIMELIPDGSLQDLLDRGKERPSLSIYRQIAEAMSVAHKRGIIHREVLMIDSDCLRISGKPLHRRRQDYDKLQTV